MAELAELARDTDARTGLTLSSEQAHQQLQADNVLVCRILTPLTPLAPLTPLS